MLKRRHANALPFLLDFSWKAIRLSWLSVMFTVGWSCVTIILRYVPSLPTLGRGFMMNGCWAVWNTFPVSVEMIMWFCLFLCWCAGSRWFFCVMLTHPSEPEMNPNLNMLYDLCVCVHLVTQSCPTLCNPVDCSLLGSSVHGDSPSRNIGVGCHALLQGIFPTQGSNPGLLHCRWIL